MTSSPSRARRLAAYATTGFSLTIATVLASGAPASLAATAAPARPAVTAVTPAPGHLGAYPTTSIRRTFTEPAHTGPTGTHLGTRSLVTVIRYPVLAAGRTPTQFPVVVFAPGYRQCDTPYASLLKSIASAGYVVAAVNFPRTDCVAGTHLYRGDLVNEPHDLTYAITRLLHLGALATGPLAGLINKNEIGAIGHSDGAVVVMLLAANTCCTDNRVDAFGAYSGAEWPSAPGSYYSRKPAPILFVQGSADTTNNPIDSVIMYDTDPSLNRYYLDLIGASHTGPVWGTNSVEHRNALVTTDFLDAWLLAQTSGLTAMKHDGNVAGVARLYSGKTQI